VQHLATAGPEQDHFVMCAVQLRDFTGVSLWHRTRASTASAAAPQAHKRASSWSAVLPASHSTFHSSLHWERFLRLLAASQAQGLLADARLYPPSDAEGPAPVCRTTARNWMAAESKNAAQHQLSRWPWSILGKEVSGHQISFMYMILVTQLCD
jgi:hypothetical protein